MAVVKFSCGTVTDRLVTLIQPPPGWDEFEFTYLHGISRQDIADAPMWPSIAPRMAEFVAGLPVYAHNAAFDARVWSQLDQFFDLSSLPDDFFCTYRLSRRVLPELLNHKLPTVLKACVPGFTLNHHQANSDAEACGLIVAALQKHPAIDDLLCT